MKLCLQTHTRSFQTCDSEGDAECLIRRPACNNLLDVFTNIRDDEDEHVKTMKACQNESIARDLAKGRGECDGGVENCLRLNHANIICLLTPF